MRDEGMRGRPPTVGRWRRGVAGGLIAGVVFAAFEVVAAALLRLAMLPLHMIGAIVLGGRALELGYPVAISATVGVLLHGLLSAAYPVTASPG